LLRNHLFSADDPGRYLLQSSVTPADYPKRSTALYGSLEKMQGYREVYQYRSTGSSRLSYEDTIVPPFIQKNVSVFEPGKI